MGRWLDGSLGQCLGSGQITNYLIHLDIIEIIQFYLKIYNLLRHPHLWLDVWVVGWMDGLICGSMGGIRSYH